MFKQKISNCLLTCQKTDQKITVYPNRFNTYFVFLVQKNIIYKSFRKHACLCDRKKDSCSSGLHCLLCPSDQTETSCSNGFNVFISVRTTAKTGPVLVLCASGPKLGYCSNGLKRLFLISQSCTFYHELCALFVHLSEIFLFEWFLFCCASDPKLHHAHMFS